MPQTHDYTKPTWGHDYIFTPDSAERGASAIGWGAGIGAGDYLILRNGDGSTRYQVDEIRYGYDPTDMWHAKLHFAPRDAPPIEA